MSDLLSQYRLSHLLDSVEGDHGAAVAIARQFAGLRATLISRLQAALHAGDGPTAVSLSHELKGMAAMIGAAQLAAVAGRVHDSARLGALDAAAEPALQAELEFHWNAVERCLAPLASRPLSAS